MNIFAYGTLMDTDIMRHVSGVSGAGKKGVVTGYSRYRVRGEQYPGIVSDGNGRVEGILYCGITDNELARLDIFEGDMYRREQVEVQLAEEGAIEKAMAYVIRPEHAHRLTGEPWDFANFLEQGKRLFEEHYCGFGELESHAG